MVASPESLESILAVLARATEDNWRTPGRAGNVVELTASLADDVMITGDLHGNRGNFETILETAALGQQPRRHLVLQEVCHGGPTYPDSGGCMSHTLLEDVARLKVEYPGRVHFLLGNHELAELVDYPIQKNRRMLNIAFRIGLEQAYGPAMERVRDAYGPLFRSCPLAVRLPGGVLVTHSIPEGVDHHGFDLSIFTRQLNALDYYGRGSLFGLLWGRDYRRANAQAFASLTGSKVLIHGHEPCAQGFNWPNDIQIVLDCCGPRAAYVILTVDRTWTHAEILDQIRLLESGAAS